jgi:threonine aldolase
MKTFASDNYSGAHPEVLEALEAANSAHAAAYGNDDYSKKAITQFKKLLGENIDVFFVFNGTAANVLGLQSAVESINSIFCASTAHLNTDECGAPEKFTGCKLIDLPTLDGKISVDQIKPYLSAIGNPHNTQPKVISITEPTEYGTLYSCDEIKELANFAHQHKMFLHMDGARISNAATGLNKSLKEITKECGVDILSFGGTKNGMMFGEAVIFFNRDLAKNFLYIQKQGMQLGSKMRFIAAQFETFLSDNLYLKNASQSNKMAQLLAEEVQKIPQIKITQKVQANSVFAVVDPMYIPLLQKEFPFYVWNNQKSEVRWMCSFDTTKEDIMRFIEVIKETLKK